MRVLIVEDDAILRDGLKVGLGIGGFNADAVESCEEEDAVLRHHFIQNNIIKSTI